MMAKPYESIGELISDRGYLLDFQKAKILEDLESVQTDDEHIEVIIDRLFYKLFGNGWDDLTPVEQKEIKDAWSGK